MSENKIIPTKYLHEGSTEQPYQVLGLFQGIIDPNNIAGQVQELGIALGVAGYEETGKVSGEQIKLIQITEGQQQILGFIKLGQFEIPDVIVGYKQLKAGSYPAGQLWWRPPENFQVHFSLSQKRV